MTGLKGKLAASAVVALLLAASPAQAQYMDIDNIINNIGSVEYLDAVARVHDTAAVRVVRLSSLGGAERREARLDRKVDLFKRDVYYLRSSLAINPHAMFAIRNSGVGLDQIVSLIMEGDGATVLFADDL